jgi:hypothetical protein
MPEAGVVQNVMAGLGPAIHVFLAEAAVKPEMTAEALLLKMKAPH